MGVHGYTRWLNKNQALILHGLRQKTNDLFWFDLFHEAAHILKHGKKPIVESEDHHDQREVEADQWAADFLIPKADWNSFAGTLKKRVSKVAIQAFAQQHQVHPGIVIGRLHKEGKLEYGIHAKLKISLAEKISDMETRPARRRIQYHRLGTLRNKLKRNQDKPLDLEAVRRQIGKAHADLRH